MVNTLKQIERQIAMSGIRDRLDAAVSQPGRYVSGDGISFGPCLLVSRECASGGSQLAKLAGQQLGWNVFDSKIVNEIAEAAHVHRKLVQAVDEHTHSVWERTWRELLLDEMPDRNYLRHLREVVMTLVHLGNVVIVGRGAQYFLPSRCGLRVRVVAPLDLRVQTLAIEENLSVEQARLRIKTADAERTGFIRNVFNQDATSALNHDIIINTGEISVESAAHIVVELLHKKLGILQAYPPKI
jgi:cytidylate kinase